MKFDMTAELLPGLPAYAGGRMSDDVYNAGDGLYDTRVIENPDEIPFFEDGVALTEEEFHAAVSALDRARLPFHYMYTKGGMGLRMYYKRRMIDVSYCGGTVSAKFADEYVPAERTPVCVRAVTETDAAAFDAYLARLADCGYTLRYDTMAEDNRIAELAAEDHLIHAVFTPGDGTARFAYDCVSAPIDTFGNSVPGIPGKTEVYQYALYHTGMTPGFRCDCGMCYIVKLADNSVFFVDGGEHEQATEAATTALWNLLHEITGTPAGEKIRIAGYFSTHAHNDHMDMFSHLLRLYHDEIALERVMFNFCADESVMLCPETYLMINRINRYFPDVKFRKLHMGDVFTLAGCEFRVMQTHEDSIGAQGNEFIGGFNDTSTVLKITFDGKSFLILGDIDDRAEAVLLRHYTAKTLKSDIVQCAHHLFNRLDYVYDVIDAEYAFVPQSERCRDNHDSVKYQVVARTVAYDNFFFANEGTDGFRVNAETGALEHHFHAAQVGGVFDGTAL